jgi:ATP-dependent DNA helicase RecQ
LPELRRWFGFESFNGRQEDVISQVMAGVDTLAVMPTGAGKSLCYQLPSVLLPGTTLVISPLIALMKDQYDSLPPDVYERTTFINSSLEMDQLSQRVEDIVAGKYKLVYCAPERLRQQPFVEALRRAKISLLVVDEAHCVSMWGHDFRPDYLFIKRCLPLLGQPAVLALTATATPQMQTEIATQLGRDLKPVVASVFRPNLFYEVEELDDKEVKLRRLLEVCKAEKGSGVVYARSRETCEQLAAMLRRSGVQAGHYHAGMEAAERVRAQERFMLDQVRVIVATIAFGMGIDKSNVRFIVHFSPPDTLEGYIQESGRAGRDGRPARCILFMSPGDKANITRWKRQEQMKVEELRAVYRELARQVPAGGTGFVNLEQIATQAGATAGKQFDQTQVRVALSMLERAHMLVRHPDAPRTVNISMARQDVSRREVAGFSSTLAEAAGAGYAPPQSGDAEYTSFLRAAGMHGDDYTRRDTSVLAQEMGIGPHELEQRLLAWSEQGWLTYRGERSSAVVERLRPPEDAAGAINKLLEDQDRAMQYQVDRMLDYAGGDECRHQMLAGHLGEKIEECGTSCDYCAPREDRPQASAADIPDLPENPGQVIVECLDSFPFNVGKPSLVKALTGSAASNITADRVRHFGALAGATPSAVSRAIDELVKRDYLAFFESADGFRLIKITQEGYDGVPVGAVVLKGKKPKTPKKRDKVEEKQREQTARIKQAYAATAQPVDTDREPTPQEADLFERLKAWRRVAANRLGLPPYMVFHDKTLWAIAMTKPTTPEELLALKGVGRGHVEKYGADLLELVAQE